MIHKIRFGLKSELIWAGFTMCAAMYVFYAVDPLARGSIIVEKLLKIWVYSLLLLSFNLWLRVNHRLMGKDPDDAAALKEHIKMTMFFLMLYAIMDLPLMIASLGNGGS